MTGRKRDDIALVLYLGFVAAGLVAACVVLIANGGAV